MKKFAVMIAIISLCSCAGITVDKGVLLHDLAWDVGYIGYTYSPQAKGYLDAGCAVLSDDTGAAARGEMVSLLSNLWTEANTPHGVAIVLLVNNLVDQLGLNTELAQNEQLVQIKAVAMALCEGVKAAKGS